MSPVTITINGQQMGEGHVMTLWAAINSFAWALEDGLGDDIHGKEMTRLYRQRIAELRQAMYPDETA